MKRSACSRAAQPQRGHASWRANAGAARAAANMRPAKGKAAALPDGEPPDGGDSADYRCLVRATDGKRHFSTAVRRAALPRSLAP